jgi:hypothetical protein
MTALPALMFIEEVRDELRIPLPTLRHWIAKGEGGPPFGRMGKKIVYKRSDVAAWVESGFTG